MDEKIKLIADSLGHDRVKLDEPVSEHSALKVGGPAKLFFFAFSEQEILTLYEMCRELKVPFFIFGTGSKMMISDKGFNGVVVKNRTTGTKIVGVKGKVSKKGIGVDEAMVEAESGLSISGLLEFLDKQGLDGGQLIGLPGSIGGNLAINAALQEKTQGIKVIEDGEVIEIKAPELSLRKHIILSSVFKFKAKNL
jgi:UDP-N-acetylmuramate dehydrogenase